MALAGRQFASVRRLVGALALGFGLASAPTLAGDGVVGVFGADDRDDVSVSNWPWIAIGRIQRADGALCSGALIGRDRVLTAAHCLVNKRRDAFVAPSDLRFDAGYARGEVRASAKIRRFLRRPTLEAAGSASPESLREDWVVLQLEKELWDGGWLRPIPIASARDVENAVADGAFIAQAGYSGDRPDILTRNDECRAAHLLQQGRLLLHRCDATFGDSGSPILTETRDGYAILGLHVAVLDLDGASYGAAVIPPREQLRGD